MHTSLLEFEAKIGSKEPENRSKTSAKANS